MDANIISGLVKKTTDKWAKQRRAEERTASAVARRRDVMTRAAGVTTKEAAYEVMEAAYMKASANNTLPAAARQIMYAARGSIQQRTGRMLSDQYFCQTLLPDFMTEHPGATANWDVVFDARGNFREPHSGEAVPLGTLQVRRYLQDVNLDRRPDSIPHFRLSMQYPTSGPPKRFGAILFVEKEGFMPLFDKVQIAARYDVAIMSTKGLSVTAARNLVDRLCGVYDVPLLILRDFDKAGFSIAGTLQNDTRRYEFRNVFRVIDLGLRLDDVEEYGLESETVSYRKTDPSHNLRLNGATKEEIAFLHRGQKRDTGHYGQRVELNAFTSDRLVEWVERKLNNAGVKKIIPDDNTLSAAFKRALKLHQIQQKIDEIAEEDDDTVVVPKDLSARIVARLRDERHIPWDAVVAQIAADEGGR
jgi:hypothetical protein